MSLDHEHELHSGTILPDVWNGMLVKIIVFVLVDSMAAPAARGGEAEVHLDGCCKMIGGRR
ncbi:hypothetical protein E2562_003787 [Oryza meyeriana var. granulata]|uniref:Uncharacterized protein n=1 Tax=Oryza meyeriana var. granulata TaxID=110450 RepID=A0A6G1BR93_9ORYZ|nr:hypothetical protein E2562_003787 [Oryza meyeriana var. granulata]